MIIIIIIIIIIRLLPVHGITSRVSSSRRGHANLLCTVPIFPRRGTSKAQLIIAWHSHALGQNGS